MKKEIIIVFLMILLLPQSSNAGVAITEPGYSEIDVNVDGSWNVKYTVDKTPTSTDVVDGKFTIWSELNGATCAGTTGPLKFLAPLDNTWKAGVEFKFDIVAELDRVYDLKVLILDAQKTHLDEEKGRYICIGFRNILARV